MDKDHPDYKPLCTTFGKVVLSFLCNNRKMLDWMQEIQEHIITISSGSPQTTKIVHLITASHVRRRCEAASLKNEVEQQGLESNYEDICFCLPLDRALHLSRFPKELTNNWGPNMVH